MDNQELAQTYSKKVRMTIMHKYLDLSKYKFRKPIELLHWWIKFITSVIRIQRFVKENKLRFKALVRTSTFHLDPEGFQVIDDRWW